MAITYPISAPAEVAQRAKFRTRVAAAVSESPFTFGQQVYVHAGQLLLVDVELPPLIRADAEAVVGFLLALNGHEGTFTMAPPGNASGVRGTWAGSPLVNGDHAAGVSSIVMDGFSAGATAKAGDWVGIGSYVHKVTRDATADGSGNLTLEIWPRLRAAVSNNAALDITAPEGLWRLATPEVEWDVEVAQIYGVRFTAMEAL